MDVGTELLMVEPMRGRPDPRMEWVRVAKMGRKWATLVSKDNAAYAKGRCTIDTLQYDGGGYHTTISIYGSLSEYEETTLTYKLWREISDIVRGYRMPDHLTLNELHTIAGILRTPTHQELPHAG